MRSIFTVYIANEDGGEGRGATLNLPASPYLLQDALERIEFKEGNQIYMEIEDSYGFEYLTPYLDEDTSLGDLNALAQKLATLDRCDSIAYEGLVKMAVAENRPFGTSHLIDLAYNANTCHIVSDAFNDEQLGHFYADNGFMPELDNLPDGIYEKLDFVKIGREFREAEKGVFTSRGYVMQDNSEEIRSVYSTLDTEIKKPDYVFRLVLTSEIDGQCVTLDLPATQKQIDLTLMEIDLDSCENVRIHDYDGPLWDLDLDLYHTGGLRRLNQLAAKVQEFESSGELTKFKAVLHTFECHRVNQALELADRLDEFVYSDHIRSPEDLARDELSFSLSDRQRQILERHVNLYAYGQDIMKDQNAALTPYGLLQREDGAPVLGVQEEQSQGGMEMA